MRFYDIIDVEGRRRRGDRLSGRIRSALTHFSLSLYLSFPSLLSTIAQEANDASEMVSPTLECG